MDMDSFLTMDDGELDEWQESRDKLKKEKEQRVMSGKLSAGSLRPPNKRKKKHSDPNNKNTKDVDAETPETADLEEPEDVSLYRPGMTMEERENIWGFSAEDLEKARKVIGVLFENPQLFEGDEELQDSRLHLVITRPRSVKRQNHQNYKKVVQQEIERRKAQDKEAIQTTGMKQERDEATQRLLQLCATPAEGEGEAEEDSSSSPLLLDSVAPIASDEPTTKEVKSTTTPTPTTGPVALEDPSPTTTSGRNSKGAATTTSHTLHKPRMCYVCKAKFRTLHHYYYAMCLPCGDYNYAKREQRRDLTGKVVLLTGCRIKIGWEMSLSLLRCGATLLATTRFAYDAVSRFAAEPDYDEWKHRLHLFSLDLRDMWMVEQFCSFVLKEFPTLFAVCHNAAQTIQRHSSYTERLRDQEVSPTEFQVKTIQEQQFGSEWRGFFTRHSSLTVGKALQLEYHPENVEVYATAAAASDGKNSAGNRKEEIDDVDIIEKMETSDFTEKEGGVAGNNPSGATTGSNNAKETELEVVLEKMDDGNTSRRLTETERVALAAHKALHGKSAKLETQQYQGKEATTLKSTAETNTAPESESTEREMTKTVAKKQPLVYDRYDTLFEASDLRTTNSWTMNMAEVDGGEATETMTINALSPFIINSRLRPALARRTTLKERGESLVEVVDPETGLKTEEIKKVAEQERRFIINVSAMEGQFCRFKLTTHPHTNMAKAALNMMTRTSGADYAKDGIFMNAVDTGWITDETPLVKKASRAAKDLLCPLDEVDAAARCLDLIYTNSNEHSQFWKDYHTILW